MREVLPDAIERIVAFFVPIACREHVLGDLRERNETVRGYVLDAVRVVPYTIWSRVRRTTPPLLLLRQAAALGAPFLASACASGMPYFQEPAPFIRLAIPVVVALFALVIADAYGDDPKPGDARQNAVRMIRPIRAAFLMGGLTQVVLFFMQPNWVLPLQLTVLAVTLVWLLIMAIRSSMMLGPTAGALATPRQVLPAPADTASSVAPRKFHRGLVGLLLFHAIVGLGLAYSQSGIARIPWFVMGLVSFYSTCRVYQFRETSSLPDVERLAIGRHLFLRWCSAPILAFLIAIVLGNSLRHLDQPELLLQIVPFVALSFLWYCSAWKRSHRPV